MNNKSNIDIQLQQIIEETIGEEIRRAQMEKGKHVTKSEIGYVISEEYGISKEVTGKAQELCGWLENAMKGKKPERIGEDGVGVYEGTIPFSCFGVRTVIRYKINNYPSNASYNTVDKTIFDGNTNSKERNITLFIAAVNKRITKECRGMVQHELQHFLEVARQGSGNPLGEKRYRSLYDKALVNLDILKKREYSESGDNIRYLLNLAVYYSLDTEVRAYINSLDNRLGYDMMDNESEIRKSEAYKALKYIKKIIERWDVVREFAIGEFGSECDKCLKLLMSGKDGYVRGIGRILAKYEMKAINENVYLSPSIYWYDSLGTIFDDLDREVSQFMKG